MMKWLALCLLAPLLAHGAKVPQGGLSEADKRAAFEAGYLESMASCRRFMKPIERPIFYELEKNGRKAFVLGTVHTGVALREMPDLVQQALRSADLVVEETGHSRWDLLNRIAKLRVELGMFRWRGPRLSDELSPSSYEFLVNSLANHGFSREMVEHLTPSVAYVLMGLRNQPRRGGRLDEEIAQWAQRHGLKVMGLETVGYQISLINQLATLQDLETALQKALAEQKSGRSASGPSLLEIYLAGDIEALHQKTQESLKGSVGLYEMFLTNRNRAWIPQLKRWMEKHERVFIAVGAAHLPGEDGILKLLEKEGYRARRVGSP